MTSAMATALETPSDEQKQLLEKYDGPPYVPSNAAGSIPFLDFANKYVSIGASYDQDPVLKGKTREEIAAALADPSTPQAKAIAGTANVFTATLCELLSSVCS